MYVAVNDQVRIFFSEMCDRLVGARTEHRLLHFSVGATAVAVVEDDEASALDAKSAFRHFSQAVGLIRAWIKYNEYTRISVASHAG